MRVALFSDTYLPTVNGVARTLGRLVDHLLRTGHEVALITPRIEDTPVEGVSLHHRIACIPAPLYPELQLARTLDRKGKRRLAEFRPDVVHVATESTVGWSGRRWARKNGVPLVTSFHTNFPEYLYGYKMGWLEGPLWRFLRSFHAPAFRTYCPSRATKEELESHGFHPRIHIWSRGVDAEHFHPSRRSDALREEMAPGAEHILLYVGRMAPEKRTEILIEAFPRIREAFGDSVALVLVGDGPLLPGIREAATEGVYCLGYRTGLALAEAYACGDIFVFPSDTETFGNVVTEAMASGLPVVAPDKGGVTETVIPGETGILTEPRDVDAVVEATLRLLRDRELRARLAKGAREAAERRTWAAIMERLVDGYRAAIDDPVRSGGASVT